MVIVVQTYLHGDYQTIIKLMQQPIFAIELIDRCNTFLQASNQDVVDLEKELLDNVHDCIYLHVVNDQLCYLDLLITNHFDRYHKLRDVLNGTESTNKLKDCSEHQYTQATSVPIPPMPAPLVPSAPCEQTDTCTYSKFDEPSTSHINTNKDHADNKHQYPSSSTSTLTNDTVTCCVPITDIREPASSVTDIPSNHYTLTLEAQSDKQGE